MICSRAKSEHIGPGRKIEVREQKHEVAEKYSNFIAAVCRPIQRHADEIKKTPFDIF